MAETTNQPNSAAPTPPIAAAPPSAPPRAISPRAARRSWIEGRVRIWWAAAIVVAAVALYFTVQQLITISHDRSLIQTGLARTAKIRSIDSYTREGYRVAQEDRPTVELVFKLPDGQEKAVAGILQHQTDLLYPGRSIEIRVDPSDLSRWTDQTIAPSLASAFTMLTIFLPVIIAFAAAAVIQRIRVLSVWKNQPVMLATAVEVSPSAVAPRSRLVRMTLVEGSDHRVVNSLVPVAAGVPRPGESFWVVAPPDAPQLALVAKLYE